MSNQKIFAERVLRINQTAKEQANAQKPHDTGRLGNTLIIPLMMTCFLAGGVVFLWDLLERPTANPLTFASNLTARALAD